MKSNVFVYFPEFCHLSLKSLLSDVNIYLASLCLNQGTCENIPGSYNCEKQNSGSDDTSSCSLLDFYLVYFPDYCR